MSPLLSLLPHVVVIVVVLSSPVPDTPLLAAHDGLVDPLAVALDGPWQAVVVLIDGKVSVRSCDSFPERENSALRSPGSGPRSG